FAVRFVGNQERGWNDPPQFSYGLQTARGPHRNLLNKRAAPGILTTFLYIYIYIYIYIYLHHSAPSCLKQLVSDWSSGVGAPPPTPPSSNPLSPPPRGVTPAPSTPRPADSSQSESEPDVERVVSVLNRALAACRQTVKDQVCSDVAKRLRLLEDSWRSGRLSLPVRRRMDTLSLALQSGQWDSADEIHRSLMVDHVTEVSQWMVGVKRLIAETRKLNPELLEPCFDQ
uniref:Steroid receptor RNA activator 1 n=1 Tax=Sander lucioperca TaxID=283035 RepID=A0A8C9Y5W0_SANLU